MTPRALLLSTVAVVSLALPAMAQDAPAQGQGNDTVLEDIVVTARKSAEKLSDAPIAVSAFSEKTIETQGIRDINDIGRLSTGLSFSQTFGRSTERPVIRGFSNVLANVQFGAESGAAYFVDGVYYPGSIQSFDLESVQRVEVIKGPQSALYGRNTYSGAINYITKDPSNELGVKLKGLAASHDEYEASISISGPIIEDVLLFRAGGRYFTYGGEYTNTLTGTKVGEEETKSGYLTLVGNFGDNIKMRLRGQYAHDQDGPLALFLQGSNANNCKPGYRSTAFRLGGTRSAPTNNNQFFCGTIQARPDLIALNSDPIFINSALGVRDGTAFDGIENKQWLGSAVVDWDIAGSGWVITSATGYRTEKNWFGADSDHSDAFIFLGPPQPATVEPAFANTNINRTKDLSTELRLASPTDARVSGLVGAYYYKQWDNQRDLTFGSPREGVPFSTASAENNKLRTTNKAVFGMLKVKLLDNLSVAGEIRYQEEEKTRIDNGFCAGMAEFRTEFNLAASIPCVDAAEFKKTTPRITVDFKPNDDTLVYAVYSQGAKPGGINGSAGLALPNPQPFYSQEKSKGWELGMKTKALDGRVSIEAALFKYDLSSVQLTTSVPGSTGAVNSVVTNQGDAKSEGVELSLQAAPIDGLLLTLGYSYVNARFTRGCDVDYYTLNSGGLIYNVALGTVPECDISGKKLPLGSPHIFNGSFAYEEEAGDSGLTWFVSGNFSYEASKYVQTDNLAETGDALLMNARFGIRGEKWSISAFGRNLTNEDSVILATRWFDLRYGAFNTAAVPPALRQPVPGQTRPGFVDTGSPRAFFGTLRKGRSFGIEGTYAF
jgi:iron complex outermembrane recepter protein